MELIDLHVHSNASDGTLTPAAVVALAVEKELTAIALTDHDTIAGIPQAIEAARGLPCPTPRHRLAWPPRRNL